MWIFTPTSFVSIVAHRAKPDVLLVRARLKGDIQRLFPDAKVSRTPSADYLFRAQLPRQAVAERLFDLAMDLDYENVKGAIPGGVKHDARHTAMSETWSTLMRAQRTQSPKSGYYVAGRGWSPGEDL